MPTLPSSDVFRLMVATANAGFLSPACGAWPRSGTADMKAATNTTGFMLPDERRMSDLAAPMLHHADHFDRKHRPWLFAKLGYGKVAIGPMWNHGLTRLEMELRAIELYRDHIGLERHQIGNATDLAIGVAIRPRRLTGVTNVVVAAEALVRAERLLVYRR